MAGMLDSLLKKEEQPSEKEQREERLKENPLIQEEPNVEPDNGKERFYLVLESMGASVEKYYFWIQRFLKEDPGHGLGLKVEKIKDAFGASSGSSFHAQMGTKASAMQQQLSGYLSQIGQLLKSLHPQIRELRILDERLEHYALSDKGDTSAEIALKSIWIEQVEQGVQNPNSVYSLARQVGFVTLPDLFFKVNAKDAAHVTKEVKGVEAPQKVKDILAKKLVAYYLWRDNTRKELAQRKSLSTKMLRQHYHTIKLYMTWLRPYLKSLKDIEMKGNLNDPDIVSAFETSKMELELLATGKGDKYIPCIRVHITFITRPELHYTQQQQRQPVHVGRTEIKIEPYVVTQEQLDDYKKNLDNEEIDFVASFDASMYALRDDLIKYLREAGEEIDDEESPVPKRPKTDYLEPLKGVGAGFKALIPTGHKNGPSRAQLESEFDEKTKAEKKAAKLSFVLYDVFKKVNGMLSA